MRKTIDCLMFSSNKPISYIPGLFILIPAAIFLIFHFLGSMPIVLWDESRLAINSLEMLQSKNYIATTYLGEPDFWNAKPSLMIFLQVLSMKIFGISEFAIRIPTAIAATGTVLIMYWFIGKKLQQPVLGIISCLVLLTSQGYMKVHGARTADYDTLLTLFTTIYAIFFYLYTKEGKTKYLYITFIAVTLAVLTKGIAGLILMPAMLLIAIYTKALRKTITSKHFYAGLGIFILFVGGYYLLREHYHPGYMANVFDNEIAGRYMRENADNGNDNYWFYYDMFLMKTFKYWHWFFITGIVTGLMVEKERRKDLTIFALLFGLTYFIIVSKARAKAEWYDMPSYPFFAIVIGIGLYYIFEQLALKTNMSRVISMSFAAIVLAIIFYKPLKTTIHYIENPDPYLTIQNNLNMGRFMRQFLDNKIDANKYDIVLDAYGADILWYVKVLQYKGKDIRALSPNEIPADESKKLVVFEPKAKDYIKNKFQYTEEYSINNVSVYSINGQK